jgi:hypothetical protein
MATLRTFQTHRRFDEFRAHGRLLVNGGSGSRDKSPLHRRSTCRAKLILGHNHDCAFSFLQDYAQSMRPRSHSWLGATAANLWTHSAPDRLKRPRATLGYSVGASGLIALPERVCRRRNRRYQGSSDVSWHRWADSSLCSLASLLAVAAVKKHDEQIASIESSWFRR